VTTTSDIVGWVTRVRDGDTIEVSGRSIRFAKLNCAEIGMPEGQQASRRMRALTVLILLGHGDERRLQVATTLTILSGLSQGNLVLRCSFFRPPFVDLAAFWIVG